MPLGTRVSRFIEIALTGTELFAIMSASVWPIALTLEIVTKREISWRGLNYFLIGCAMLAIATVVRRDRQRLLFLIGPFFLCAYSSLLACVGIVLLLNGEVSASIIAVVALAAAVAALSVRWHLSGGQRPYAND